MPPPPAATTHAAAAHAAHATHAAHAAHATHHSLGENGNTGKCFGQSQFDGLIGQVTNQDICLRRVLWDDLHIDLPSIHRLEKSGLDGCQLALAFSKSDAWYEKDGKRYSSK